MKYDQWMVELLTVKESEKDNWSVWKGVLVFVVSGVLWKDFFTFE